MLESLTSKILCEGICGKEEARGMFQMERTENGGHSGISELLGCWKAGVGLSVQG